MTARGDLGLDAIVALDADIAALQGRPLSIEQSSALRSAWRRCASGAPASRAALIEELHHRGDDDLAHAVRVAARRGAQMD